MALWGGGGEFFELVEDSAQLGDYVLVDLEHGYGVLDGDEVAALAGVDGVAIGVDASSPLTAGAEYSALAHATLYDWSLCSGFGGHPFPSD